MHVYSQPRAAQGPRVAPGPWAMLLGQTATVAGSHGYTVPPSQCSKAALVQGGKGLGRWDREVPRV